MRKQRLYSCACCYRMLEFYGENASIWRPIVELIERHADGRATVREMEEVQRKATTVAPNIASTAGLVAVGKAVLSATASDVTEAGMADNYAANAIAYATTDYLINVYSNYQPVVDAVDVAKEMAWSKAKEDDLALQATLLRDIVGNPFRPVNFDPRWLTSAVTDLANTIYTERAFDRMPLLADALMDAGCDHEKVINHCRSEGPHVRGCWVVDQLLGKS